MESIRRNSLRVKWPLIESSSVATIPSKRSVALDMPKNFASSRTPVCNGVCVCEVTGKQFLTLTLWVDSFVQKEFSVSKKVEQWLKIVR